MAASAAAQTRLSQPRQPHQVKTALEIPDPVFRRAKSVAAQRGIALRALVTEAVEEKLAAGIQT